MTLRGVAFDTRLASFLVDPNKLIADHHNLSAVTKDVIPFGSVWGVHAHLEGLNLVGLKRRGFSRETINDLRSAYRLPSDVPLVSGPGAGAPEGL